MTENNWERVEGVMIGRHADPKMVVEYLNERHILSQIEWYPISPQLLGVCFAQNSDRAIAVVTPDGQDLQAGAPVEQFVNELAEFFEAEVRAGDYRSDYLVEPIINMPELFDEDDEGWIEPEGTRVVEVGRTPLSSVPVLAALEGCDVGVVELGSDCRALLTEMPVDKVGWNFGSLPLVSLSLREGALYASVVFDDHFESTVSYTWGMEHVLTGVPAGKAASIPVDIRDLVGDGLDLDVIAAFVPDADAEALRRTACMRGDESVYAVVRALGLPRGIASFLLGESVLDEVPDARVYEARRISQAIGRSVDMMLEDREAVVHPGFAAYRALDLDRPWIVRTGAAAEAVVGAGLVAWAARSRKPRSVWSVVGALAGTAMLVDSVAELFLAKYVRQRVDRS
ncbi:MULTISPECIES: hypothetical protein [unclassified Schaalia]|uniref:hypothetical protein n=1 Tax=unclassified Schaalia TaxID=2691889 RepID=UPI001E46F29F|nr:MULTISPECIES: hypothetical protein [unclassified Schaalia]MCD4549935.1 hypothetical protein [Schaalia sp. lx-260]MCD4557707.1 hypothetical protein [Schaalia sp. lx-100]